MFETEEERSQFEQLYIEYKQDMYAIAYNILGNNEDAEDAVHQSFLKIAEKFTEISSFSCQKLRSYIVIISSNTAKNIYKQNKRRADKNTVFDAAVSIPDDYFEMIDYFELKETIKKLPQDYKDVIYLYYTKDLSAKDIADLLDISTANVYKRISRARMLLKEYLEGCETIE